MQLKRIASVAIAFVGIAAIAESSGAFQAKALVIEQPEAPLTITQYQARYVNSKDEVGISHRLEYQNKTDRRIQAVEVGLVAFDIWNEFIEKIAANDLDRIGGGRSGDGAWLHNPQAAFIFHTGIAYISRVRFEDGEIWTADTATIAEQIKGVHPAFTVEMLKTKGN